MKRTFFILLMVIICVLSAVSQNLTFRPLFSAALDTTEGFALLKQCSRSTPKNISGFWKISPMDMDTLEANFRNIYAVVSNGCCGNGLQVKDLDMFAFQYIGVIAKGKKFIYVNAFPYTRIETIKRYGFSFDPAKKAMMVCDVGDSFWGSFI